MSKKKKQGKLFAWYLTKGPKIRGKPRGWWCENEINSSDSSSESSENEINSSDSSSDSSSESSPQAVVVATSTPSLVAADDSTSHPSLVAAADSSLQAVINSSDSNPQAVVVATSPPSLVTPTAVIVTSLPSLVAAPVSCNSGDHSVMRVTTSTAIGSEFPSCASVAPSSIAPSSVAPSSAARFLVCLMSPIVHPSSGSSSPTAILIGPIEQPSRSIHFTCLSSSRREHVQRFQQNQEMRMKPALKMTPKLTRIKMQTKPTLKMKPKLTKLKPKIQHFNPW